MLHFLKAQTNSTNGQVQVWIKIHESVPELACSDRSRLQQIISCFLSNALNFSQNKPVHVNVHADPKHLIIFIVDEGAGLPRSILDQISCIKIVETEQVLKLSLYTCSKLVEHFGGRVYVSSRIGQGTLFKLVIPCLFSTLSLRELNRRESLPEQTTASVMRPVF